MLRLFTWCLLGAACAPEPQVLGGCTTDLECDDGNGCTGAETCDADGTCLAGSPITCDLPQVCANELGVATCAVVCDLPRAPVLDLVDDAETLRFTGAGAIETAVLDRDTPLGDADWLASDTLDATPGWMRVLARSDEPECVGDRFDHLYEVVASFPGGAETPSSRAIAKDDERLVAWATGHTSLEYGEGVDAAWRAPSRAYGAAQGTSGDVVSLGTGGAITLTFGAPLADGEGPDLAVFENGFDDTYLELAYVEVSSDGTTFARFDSAALTPEPVGSFGRVDPATVHGLAGVYRQGYGTPFDLSLLRYHPLVRTGQLDLANVRYVRVVDVVGDGSDSDSFGRPIHDPWPNTGSAGFDLDAIGVLSGQRR